ncbi:MAG: VCBS repeat-containing protein [Lewinellaceae bacterium]|nr:VCBS repeat-containing protein [Lewinellaceae bacterium]
MGASVLIEYNGQIQFAELNPTHGIFSSVEHLIHFGLGKTSNIDKLSVRWPDGKTQTLTNVTANQRLQLKYKDAAGRVASLVPQSSEPTLFRDLTASSNLKFEHKENSFIDFESFPLMPWKESELGPALANADVNGDGLDDFFVGNGFNAPAALYIQTPDGRFTATGIPSFQLSSIYEDHGAVFFDFEGDGDLDLFVVGGGYECNPAGRGQAFQARIYLNSDGKGNFVLISKEYLPAITDIGFRVTAFDYDLDGDDDLFIGGRIVPDKWPLTPRSLVLRNDRNKLSDVTAQIAGDFEKCGMVTDLQWADINGDKKPEMLVTGEWMPISVFEFQGGKLVNATAKFGMDRTNGLWNRLATADLDGDGDLDLITGNMGLNVRFRASQEAPMRCFAADFDHNGTLDPVVTRNFDGKDYPLFSKSIMTKQMPGLKKRFLYAKDYAQAAIEDVFPEKDLKASLQLAAYDLETCWWENKGGKFIRHSLPSQVQASPIFGILANDFNGDGKTDLLLAGNKYGFDVETGHCDAGTGVLLLGDGKGGFAWVPNLKSGFWANLEARDLALLHSKNGRLVVVANNSGPLQVFGVK